MRNESKFLLAMCRSPILPVQQFFFPQELRNFACKHVKLFLEGTLSVHFLFMVTELATPFRKINGNIDHL